MLIGSESEITRNFDGLTIVKARELERKGLVADVQVEPGMWIHGRVLGEAGRSYEQVLKLAREPTGLTITGECTCSSKRKCRHIAAILLKLFHEQGKSLADDGIEAGLPPTTPQVERWLAAVTEAALPKNSFPDDVSQRLVYLLDLEETPEGCSASIRVESAKYQRGGQWSETTQYRTSNLSNHQFAKYVRPSDVKLLRALDDACEHLEVTFASYGLTGVGMGALLGELVATGRLYWRAPGSKPLKGGKTKSGNAGWEMDLVGDQRFRVEGVGRHVLPTVPPIYVDEDAGLCGFVEVGLDPELAGQLLAGPVIRPEYSRRVKSGLAAACQCAKLPLPSALPPPRVIKTVPTVRLTILTSKTRYKPLAKSSHSWLKPAGASLEFLYGGFAATGLGHELRVLDGGKPITFLRDPELEATCRSQLLDGGWSQATDSKSWDPFSPNEEGWLLNPSRVPPNQEGLEQDFAGFVHVRLPELRELGWEIVSNRRTELTVQEVRSISAELSEDSSEYLQIRLFSDIAGARVDLRDAIKFGMNHSDLFQRDIMYFGSESEGLLALPSKRVAQVIDAVDSLAGPSSHWADSWAIPKARLAEADVLSDVVDELTTLGRLTEFADGLREAPSAAGAVLSPRFIGEMRPYQQQGLAWLQLLARFGIGGILADDMGLGKTVQALAFIASQRDSQKEPKPFLIVAPTSTLPNWEAEAAKFTPSLRLLKLHGPTRRLLFSEIDCSDVVLTSFTLLAKDAEALHQHEFAGVILDEAQMIKNSATHVARAAYATKSPFRLAMSGTPIENNLDELWSLFRFVTPGLLGTSPEFKRDFRIPIEVGRNSEVHGRLAKRIRPFILRRTKETVAKELPAKVTVAERVELEEQQRALYERIRGSVANRIQATLADKGFDKSRMEVLEALLRLRQACCDPRLLPDDLRGSDHESGKLTRLMEMVDELVAQNRRALVFSQFTSMLDLIEPELKARNVPFLRLSGDTRDRATPVQRFQNGEAPIFLISLRAGGTGLNLTAADTVVHFDPWWNPAVENQATDRAHRIGQDKTVFVYKLVAANTVEERILELQERKAALAEGLLDGHTDFAAQLTEADLMWLLKS